eukprot:COSAG02_NODE_9323_length_2256_cov_1.277701_3_plen_36_part_00
MRKHSFLDYLSTRLQNSTIFQYSLQDNQTQNHPGA